jgi:predicted N-acetyltransferase YhbS
MTTGQPVIRSLRPADLPQVFDLLRTCFIGTPPDHFVKQHLYDSTFRPWQGRVAEMDCRVVAYVRIFDRRMRVRGVPLRAAGIGSVATHPDVRRRSLASTLLADAIRVMQRRGYPISFLYTGITAFYERLGWRVVAQPYLRVPADEAAALAPAGPPYRLRVFEPADLPLVRRVFALATRNTTGAIVRSEEYWRDHLWWANDDARFFLVAERQGTVAGYVRGQVEAERQRLIVLECETLPSDRPAARALLAGAARRALSLGLTMVYCQAPLDSAMTDAFRACPGAESRPAGRAPDMQLLVRPDRALRALLPWLRRAARQAPGPDATLAIGDAAVRLAAGEALLTTPGPDAVQLDRHDAILALLGQRSVVECLAPRVLARAEVVDRLDAALPRCAYHFWYPDRI